MASKVLVVNAGSSSLKFKVYEKLKSGLTAAVGGIVERIGDKENSALIASSNHDPGKQTFKEPIQDHTGALDFVLDYLKRNLSARFQDEVEAIGHRVVHGREISDPLLIDEHVIEAIKHASNLAPLHNPPNLEGIFAAQNVFGSCPQVAVFDTAFHQTMPPAAYTYGLPLKYRTDAGIRKYGFHGTSYKYLVQRAAKVLGKPEAELNLIVGHIGAGASMAAIKNGQSIDTTMGLTPLEGLVMGTRCGDLDPAIALYMQNTLDMSTSELDKVFNKQSGLLGLCGKADLRAVLEERAAGNANAQLAVDVYVHRIRRYLGAYLVYLAGKVDAIVFSAGAGENSALLRELVLKDLEAFGIEVDKGRNEAIFGGKLGEIQSAKSRIKVLVIPTDEELSIAEQTLEVVQRSASAA